MSLPLGHIFRIRAKTIRMHRPIQEGTAFLRNPVIQNKGSEKFMSDEAFLRKTAYKDTSIKTGPAFFDDSDMISDYFLVVVYDKKTQTPLLSSRYYFEQETIHSYVKGDSMDDACIHPEKYSHGTIFLADRLSGNISSSLYRAYRDYIFQVFYLEIYKHNKNCKFILMARKEKQEKLLAKYLRLGLHVVGSASLRGKEHWVLLGDLKEIYRTKKISIFPNLFMLVKLLLQKLKL